jgi:mannose-6-phosphate isomerase
MQSDHLYPYVLQPKETTAIWGGESWKCWDENLVRNGSLAGKRLSDLRSALGEALLGNIDPARLFPILTKIITTHDWLSVQVHPDDAYARRIEHQENGKTESWYIFSAQERAELVLGWTRDVSREEYERRVADGSLGELLRRVPVKNGDAFYLPAGMLHAIGSGIVLFETQQASDLTYRIFDWNRLGLDGKPRQLAVEKAADVLDYRASASGALQTIDYIFDSLHRTVLIADKHFVVERITATSEPASIATHDRPLIVMPTEPGLSIGCGQDDVVLGAGDCAIVPAVVKRCTVCTIGERASTTFMLVTPPASSGALRAQLLAAGVEQARVDAFDGQFGH